MFFRFGGNTASGMTLSDAANTVSPAGSSQGESDQNGIIVERETDVSATQSICEVASPVAETPDIEMTLPLSPSCTLHSEGEGGKHYI